MIAYKGFNQNLSCTQGRGTFKYEVGKTYTEDECKVAKNGFHCVEEPIRVLDWYRERFCVVEIKEDINERDNKLTASCMTILKEIDILQLAVHECIWIQKHPDRKMSDRVSKDAGKADKNDTFVIVRGKNPRAAGDIETTLFLLQEEKNSKKIKKITVLFVDGQKKKVNTYYDINEKEVIADDGKGKAKKIKNSKGNSQDGRHCS